MLLLQKHPSVTQLRRVVFLVGLQHDSRVVRNVGKWALLSEIRMLGVDVCFIELAQP